MLTEDQINRWLDSEVTRTLFKKLEIEREKYLSWLEHGSLISQPVQEGIVVGKLELIRRLRDVKNLKRALLTEE